MWLRTATTASCGCRQLPPPFMADGSCLILYETWRGCSQQQCRRTVCGQQLPLSRLTKNVATFRCTRRRPRSPRPPNAGTFLSRRLLLDAPDPGSNSASEGGLSISGHASRAHILTLGLLCRSHNLSTAVLSKIPHSNSCKKSAKSASTTPQRPIWNYFATVGVRDFWENGCMCPYDQLVA